SKKRRIRSERTTLEPRLGRAVSTQKHEHPARDRLRAYLRPEPNRNLERGGHEHVHWICWPRVYLLIHAESRCMRSMRCAYSPSACWSRGYSTSSTGFP